MLALRLKIGAFLFGGGLGIGGLLTGGGRFARTASVLA